MKRNGAEEVTLETEWDNTAALSLYASLGFIREKRLYRFYMSGKDAFRLVLALSPRHSVDESRQAFAIPSFAYNNLISEREYDGMLPYSDEKEFSDSDVTDDSEGVTMRVGVKSHEPSSLRPSGAMDTITVPADSNDSKLAAGDV
ncbi:N-alpha-acetyltransferase mak3 [Tulasnella sp. 419]|nr:N-alpha-acetyltransferase mak3 [Tulasnella sp. 419]